MTKRGSLSDYTKAGPCITTRADGTVEVAEALTPFQLRRKVEEGRKAPRTWNEDHQTGRGAGGGDTT